MTPLPTQTAIGQNRLKQVFGFLLELQRLRHTTVSRVEDQPWHYWLRDLPNHSTVTHAGIETSESADTDSDGGAGGDILRVERPSLSVAPQLPVPLQDWIERGWEDCLRQVTIVTSRPIRQKDGTIDNELFESDPDRVAALADWRELRDSWAELERPARQAMALFEQLYELWGRVQREGERVELVLGDGILRWDRPEGRLNHPVLLQPLQLLFDPRAPAFTLVESDRAPEFYSAIFRDCDDVDGGMIATVRRELEVGNFHPLGASTSGLLRSLAQRLSPQGKLVSFDDLVGHSSDPRIARSPVIFLRQRTLGYVDMIETIIDDIPNRKDLPTSLLRICGIDTNAGFDSTFANGTIAHGEHGDVLLSKPANAEQIEIARKLLAGEQSILVQGPPGTGKTHTIANLVGHLLAQGKTVLITSHTTKALRVLREKVVEPLQPLCVSLLDSDMESRDQLQSSVMEITRRLMSGDTAQLDQEAGRLKVSRDEYLRRLGEARNRLRSAREDEYREVLVGGVGFSPAEAARIIREGYTSNGWVPGPVEPGKAIPLAPTEVAELYASNAIVSLSDQRELETSLPTPDDLPTPARFRVQVNERAELLRQDRISGANYWSNSLDGQDLNALRALLETVQHVVIPLATADLWRFAAIADALRGDVYRGPWEKLVALIEQAVTHAASSRSAIIEYAPAITTDPPVDQQVELYGQIIEHLERGGSLPGKFLGNKEWRRLIEQSSVGGKRPSKLEHFKALHAFTRVLDNREQLRLWWRQLLSQLHAPSSEELGDEPEEAASQYIPLLREALQWHTDTWQPVERQLAVQGFQWPRLMQSMPPIAAQYGDLRRLQRSVTDHLVPMLAARIAAVRLRDVEREFTAIAGRLARFAITDRPASDVVVRLRAAVKEHDEHAYEVAFDRLLYLTHLRSGLGTRKALITKLESAAPGWAAAVDARIKPHDAADPPGDALLAWQWRQLEEELNRRSVTSIEAIQREIRSLVEDLQRTTAELAEQRAWAAQARRTSLPQRQSLTGWLQAVRRIGKGTGKRAPVLRAEARRLMTDCRSAVPVWIMPLSRVAENFNARTARFDVVIIDEASQSDVTALIALYLGKQVLIVGDDEQVTPDAVGQNLDTVQRLIDTYLREIPNGALYDGQQSIYHLAQQSASGTIMLQEHFRCAPDIISFSNHLSYNGMMRPLRDPMSINLQPNVVEYQVQGWRGDGKTNEEEAEAIVALIAAAHEDSRYVGKTFGVISLVGDEQARLIETKLRTRLPIDTLEGRRIMCGTPPQFQGDERDVIILSMVDSPGNGPLALRAIDSFKRRYNVAASRARDQMWLVHSLNPSLHLKQGDLRRRLIEHFRDPQAVQRLISQAEQKTESEFERLVLRHLMNAGYSVRPQVEVGFYRIDLVVEGVSKQLAVECDGDRYHPIEKLGADMERQAILERLGWTFVRIRGSEFFRDQDKAMSAVYRRLRELEILPAGPDGQVSTASASTLTDDIIRRAEALRREWSSAIGARGLLSSASATAPTIAMPPRDALAVLDAVSESEGQTSGPPPIAAPWLSTANGSNASPGYQLEFPFADRTPPESDTQSAPNFSLQSELSILNQDSPGTTIADDGTPRRHLEAKRLPVPSGHPTDMANGRKLLTRDAVLTAVLTCLPDQGETSHERLLNCVSQHLGTQLSGKHVRSTINNVLNEEMKAGRIGTDSGWSKHWRLPRP